MNPLTHAQSKYLNKNEMADLNRKIHEIIDWINDYEKIATFWGLSEKNKSKKCWSTDVSEEQALWYEKGYNQACKDYRKKIEEVL